MSSSPKLVVKDFACFDSVEIELNQLSIFIGPQASGKSLLIKLIYYFNSILSDFVDLSLDAESKPHFLRQLQERFSKFFPLVTCGVRNFEIQYLIGNEWIKVVGVTKRRKRSMSQTVKVTLSAALTKTFSDLRMKLSWTMTRPMSSSAIDYKAYDQRGKRARELAAQLSEQTGCQVSSTQIFIPAGRSFFSLLDQNIYRFLQSNNSLDPFFAQFGVNYEAARNGRLRIFNESNLSIKQREEILAQFDAQCAKVLKGNLINRRNNLFLSVDHQREIPLGLSSSGQQEAVPMIMVLKHLLGVTLARDADAKGQQYIRDLYLAPTLYFEEPEAHLFPLAQREMVDLLLYVLTAVGDSGRFIVTTHSPYVLAALNMALKRKPLDHQSASQRSKTALRLGQLKHEQGMRPPISWEKISAYEICDGTVKSILDQEGQLIDASVIDRVSDIIFDELDSVLAK